MKLGRRPGSSTQAGRSPALAGGVYLTWLIACSHLLGLAGTMCGFMVEDVGTQNHPDLGPSHFVSWLVFRYCLPVANAV
jgi:hypothetical protein